MEKTMKKKYRLKKSAITFLVIFIFLITLVIFMSLAKSKSYSVEYNINEYDISENYDKDKEIKVNGKKVGGDILLSVGDEVCYYLTKKQEEKPAYYAVYEDENFFIADKESGVNAEAVFADNALKL